MTLTGAQLSRIHQAILPAYSRDELRRVVLAGMNEEFSHHVSPEKAYSDQVFEFVTWADRQGRALELLRCAAEGNERNAGLQTLWAEAQGWDAPVHPAQTPEPSTSPAMPHHVFLTYSRKDDAIMRRLVADLLAAGLDAWVDQEDLEPGTEVWQSAIEAAIREAKCVVVILTPDAKESDGVNNEITLAQRIQRRIYPVLARGDEDSAVPLALEATLRIDIRTDYTGSVEGKLIPALRKHLGMTEAMQQARSGNAVAPPAEAPPAKPAQPIAAPRPDAAQPPIDIEWVTIPAGEFHMGSDKQKDEQARDNETPQYRLYLPAFQIGKHPITNAQYEVFVKATGYRAPEHWVKGIISKGKESHPIVNVTWEDAQAFCGWAEVRLPSEAEWEKAARGTDGRIWPWGNDAPTKERCNFGRKVGDTTPVGQYPKGASPYGCLDMAGNVWEWTGSLPKPYPYQPNDGREDPKRLIDPKVLKITSQWQI